MKIKYGFIHVEVADPVDVEETKEVVTEDETSSIEESEVTE